MVVDWLISLVDSLPQQRHAGFFSSIQRVARDAAPFRALPQLLQWLEEKMRRHMGKLVPPTEGRTSAAGLAERDARNRL
jgi:hypothetical protein